MKLTMTQIDALEDFCLNAANKNPGTYDCDAYAETWNKLVSEFFGASASMLEGQAKDYPRVLAELIAQKEVMKLASDALNRFCDPAQFATIPGIGDPHNWLFHYQEDEFPWLLAQKAFDAIQKQLQPAKGESHD